MLFRGSGFDSRAEIAPLVQTIDRPVVRSFGELAATYGAYLALGLAERESNNDILLQQLILLGSDGRP